MRLLTEEQESTLKRLQQNYKPLLELNEINPEIAAVLL